MNWVITLTSFSKESLVRVREGKLRSLIRVVTAFINQWIVLLFLSLLDTDLSIFVMYMGVYFLYWSVTVIQRPKIELCSRSFHYKQNRRKWQPERATTLGSFGIERSNQHVVLPIFLRNFPKFYTTLKYHFFSCNPRQRENRNKGFLITALKNFIHSDSRGRLPSQWNLTFDNIFIS